MFQNAYNDNAHTSHHARKVEVFLLYPPPKLRVDIDCARTQSAIPEVSLHENCPHSNVRTCPALQPKTQRLYRTERSSRVNKKRLHCENFMQQIAAGQMQPRIALIASGVNTSSD